MLTTLIGLPLDQIDTPALIVDLDTLDRNMAQMAAAIRERGIGWRPHAKAHKSPAIAHRELAADAIGITCAKLGEAEVFAAAGIRDILIANQLVGPIKARRLAALATYCDVIVAVDNIDNARELDGAAAEFGSRPRVLLEIDSGMHRAGVAPGADAVALANQVAALPSLRFAGVMGWEGHAVAIADGDERASEIRASVGRLVSTADAIRESGIPVEIVSCGGTGTFLTVREMSGVTEVQAGGGIFGDGMYRALDVPVEPALSLVVSVTSRPTPRRIIIDAGRKSVDPSAQAPEVVGIDGVVSVAFSAEHGTIVLDRDAATPRAGDRVTLHLGYSDQAIHLHDQLLVARSGRLIAIWPTLTRGKLQ
ncbi:MAG: DSD1 family PLP-dependent enzyme [Thermomicrobiales bacterium]